ncbi:hypothetical protein LCGC14_1336940 [marine sediment metagenome]|uniref:Uncharacterized protein n=1 Tax=marine sediment metagenome TaxID=412755 RepID=A0A0F9L151_9ZZZZ
MGRRMEQPRMPARGDSTLSGTNMHGRGRIAPTGRKSPSARSAPTDSPSPSQPDSRFSRNSRRIGDPQKWNKTATHHRVTFLQHCGKNATESRVAKECDQNVTVIKMSRLAAPHKNATKMSLWPKCHFMLHCEGVVAKMSLWQIYHCCKNVTLRCAAQISRVVV